MSSPDKGQKRQYSEDEEMVSVMASSSSTARHPLIHQHNLAWNKRMKTGNNKKTSLDLKLATMDKDKLLQMLTSLLETQPDLKHDIMTYIPAPTVVSALAVLNNMEKKMWSSFPYKKQGPQRDHYTFSRVRESLLDLIDTITHYSHHFVSSSSVFPTTYFLYLDQVTYVVHRLPTWGTDHANQLRQDLYADFAMFWTKAIQRTFDTLTLDASFHPDTVATWAISLAHHATLANNHHGGTFDHVIQHFNQCFRSPPLNPTCQPVTPVVAATTTSVASPLVGFTDFTVARY